MQKLLFIVPVVLVFCFGCGVGNGGRVPAVGQVTLDGVPLGNVYVTFRPDDGERGNGGFATTDAAGRFEIYYPDTGKGLIPARYRVTITNPPERAADHAPVPAANISKRTARSSKYPAVYSSPENSPLRVTVTADGTPLKVELSSHPK